MSGKVTPVNRGEFEREVLQADQPVLVDFWAPWCGPCRMVAPVVEALAEELDGKLKVVKVNTDDNPELAMKFGIMSIPTLMVFKGGREVERFIGFQPKPALQRRIEPHLD